MITEATIRICIWDNLPIHESPIYRTLAYEHGVKAANMHARRICIDLSHPPPEVIYAETIGNTPDSLGVAG